MGCSLDSQEKQTLVEQYMQYELPLPEPNCYDNELEKEIFLAINLCRLKPSSFITSVKTVSENYPLV